MARVNGTARLVFDLSSLQEAERALRRMVAQVHELGREAAGPSASSGDLVRTIERERARTRRHFVEIVSGECGRLHELLDALEEAGEEAAHGRAEPVAV